MKKFNFSIIFLMLLTGFSLFLGNTPITSYTNTPESLSTTEVNPVPAAMQLNLGAFIIIGGDRSDHHLVELMKSGCDLAYFILASRGFSTSDMLYLGPDYGTPGLFQDMDATHANVEYAITTWAAGKVDATHGLGIYLLDHGGSNFMCLPGSPDLSDTDLNTWLDTLETSTGCNRVVIIYDACRAGSIINPVSKNNRIVITSTTSSHSAYGTSDGTWAWFSEAFFSSIVQCKTIGECFEDAVAHIEAVGSPQYPWIDDNHDETGHEVGSFGHLPNGGDGSDALNYWIGSGSNCPITLIQWLPLIAYVKINVPMTPVWAVVQNFSKIEKVYVRVIPPEWVPPEPPEDKEGVKMIIDPSIFVQELKDPDGDGNFTGNLYPGRYRNFFNMMGDYKLTFHARSADGSVADIESSHLILNEDGKPPQDTTPPTIVITNPEDDETIDGSVKIKASGDDDQALAKIQIYFDDELVKEEDMPPYLPYPEVSYRFDTEDYEDGTYTIMAKAIDNSDNEATHSIEVEILNEDGPIIPGFSNASLLIGSLIGVAIISIHIKRKKVEINR